MPNSVDIYKAVCALSRILSLDFSFPKKTGGKQRNIPFPELRLMALVVVSVKLYHPFDNLTRYISHPSDLGNFQIDWNVWCDEHKRYENRETSAGKLGRGNEMRVTEKDVFGLSIEQLDEYLDWYERTWVNEPQGRQRKGDLTKELFDMFPTGRLDGSASLPRDVDGMAGVDQAALNTKLEAVQGSLQIRGVISDEEEENSDKPVRRLGSFYKRYRKVDTLPPHAKMFFGVAAGLIGVSLSTMSRAVSRIEQTLLNYRAKELRKSRAEESDADLMEGIQMSSDGREGEMVDHSDGSLSDESLW